MDATEIIQSVFRGDADDNLNGIIAACHDRRKQAGKANFHALKVGDRVRLVGGQKYIQGAEGKVVRKNQTKLVVDLDEPRGKFHIGIVCPPELLEKV